MLKKYKEIAEVLLSIICYYIALLPIYLKYSQKLVVVLLGIIGSIVLLVDFFNHKKVKKVCNFIIDKRYFIATIVFIICLVFKLHTSSIGCYHYLFKDEANKVEATTILGMSRVIRSDEYMVHTPYYFSQYYNNYKKISKQMSLTGQDMIIGYNAPVKDISLLAKPLTWGYVLLGNEYGLSWYFSLKIILLILISYEFVMILTKNNKKVSIMGTLLISYSPAIQWWFVPHMADVFLWSMALCVIAYHFFTTNKKWLKNLLTIIAPLVLSVFVLALFPSCQIPLGIIAFCLFVGALVRDKEKINFEKKDIFRILFIFLVAIIILSYSLLTSLDAIKLLYDTVYPGKRVSLGGQYTFRNLFTNLTTLFLPYKESNVLNNCEVSDFIHIVIPCVIIFPFIYKRLKEEKDSNLIIGKIIFISLIIEVVFMLVGFNELLAKLTLFSYINRMELVYGFTSVLFSLWTISILWKYKDILSMKIKIFSILIFIIGYYLTITQQNIEYLPIYVYLLEILAFSILVFSIYQIKQKNSILILFFILVVSSFTINPIAYGTTAITDYELISTVKKTITKNNQYVLTTDSLQLQSLLFANGLKTINGVNFYPDLKKWKLIDSKEEYKDIYNRYYHTEVRLTDKKTNFELKQADMFILNLNILDIKKWPVKTIVSGKSYDDLFKQANIKFQKKKSMGYFIYILE